MNMMIRLDSMEKVKEFVNIAGCYTGKIQVSSGRYTVDGRSIMGIFSLELSSDLSMEIEDKEESSQLIRKLQRYIVA